MTDMRLPGVSPANNETSPKAGSADSGSDPAQAFDAVMSRFSNQRAPAGTSSQESAARTGTDAARAESKASAAGKGQDARAGGRPVARTKALDDEEPGADSAAMVATGDPAAMVAALTGSAQLTGQDSALAASLDGVTAARTDKGKDTKTDAATAAAGTIDVLAVQGSALAAHAGEKLVADVRPSLAREDDVKPGAATATTTARRTTLADKDTLRIEAPETSAIATGKGDALAQRSSVLANAVAQATTAQDSSPAATTASPQGIAGAVAASTNGTGTYSIAHAAVDAPVGTPAFASELSQRVVVFAGQKVQRAEIALTPPELGPIAVSIEVRGQEATLAFAASNHTTRAAIENALPQLREMLSAQGLQLAGTHVGSEPRRDPYRPASNGGNASGNRNTREQAVAVSSTAGVEVRRGTNLIDIEV